MWQYENKKLMKGIVETLGKFLANSKNMVEAEEWGKGALGFGPDDMLSCRPEGFIESRGNSMSDEEYEIESQNNEFLAQQISYYHKLCEERHKIFDDLTGLIIRTPYFPLTGLNVRGRQLLRRIDKQVRVDKSRSQRMIKDLFDELLQTSQEDMIRRYKQLPEFIFDAYLDFRIMALYKQAVRCHVNGAFQASCVLCRAIVELIAKKRIDDMGYGQGLAGKVKNKKKKTVPEMLIDYSLCPKKLVGIYQKICGKADRILHELNEKVDEKNSAQSIKLLRQFIKKFPKGI